MKKIIGIVIASLLFWNIGYAAMSLIEKKSIGGNPVSTICVDRYKFVTNVQIGTSIVQFYEERDGKSLPAKC